MHPEITNSNFQKLEKPKNHNSLSVQSKLHSCLLLKPERSMDGEVDFLKLLSQSFCSRRSGFPKKEKITMESTVAARQYPFSYKGQHLTMASML
jgi:hypothetical protein